MNAQVVKMNKPANQNRDPLNLSGLPMVEPPRDGWPEIKAALQGPTRAPWSRRNGLALLATAAAVTLAVGLYLQQGMRPPVEIGGSPETRHAVEQPPQTKPGNDSADADSRVTLAALTSMSQDLEDNLRLMRSGVGDLPLEAAMYQIELEDLVAQVDDALSITPDSKELWGQRVNLLIDLGSLYQDQLRREYGQLASL
jgi:hypothetical protein